MYSIFNRKKKTNAPSVRNEKQGIREQKDDEAFERCVVCGAPTSVKKSTHIDLRDDYIAGLGQTCHKCNAIYCK